MIRWSAALQAASVRRTFQVAMTSDATKAASKASVIILTSTLGSGKTTLLNRILTAEHGRRVAVIVNEFGEVGIDHHLLLSSDQEVVQMNNGCVCCTVRGDLVRSFFQLMEHRDKFDTVVIETTGLAEPAPWRRASTVMNAFEASLRWLASSRWSTPSTSRRGSKSRPRPASKSPSPI